jgi:hypothetical protein
VTVTTHQRSPAAGTTLAGFTTPIFAQANPTEIASIAPLVAGEGLGTVVVTRSRTTAEASVALLRDADANAAMLLDAERYAGKRRLPGTTPFDLTWIQMQRRLGLAWILTDSGYIGAGDLISLRSVLQQARQLGPGVIALLPIANLWLSRDLKLLVAEIESAGVPVAIAVEHKKDPLSAGSSCLGLHVLFQVSVPVFVLRCDVSALGALAHGAVGAAVGTSTKLRHIYPLSQDNAPRPPPPRLAAFVPALLAYVSMAKIERGILADADSPVWQCYCTVCYGRTMDWIINSTSPDAAAYCHSLSALSQIAHDLVSIESLDDRRLSWRAQCQHAQARHFEIEDSASGWEPAAALGAWVKVPVSHATA